MIKFTMQHHTDVYTRQGIQLWCAWDTSDGSTLQIKKLNVNGKQIKSAYAGDIYCTTVTDIMQQIRRYHSMAQHN